MLYFVTTRMIVNESEKFPEVAAEIDATNEVRTEFYSIQPNFRAGLLKC
jgi:carbamoylphosphate synthase large subunit